jgi:hypothetical protein
MPPVIVIVVMVVVPFYIGYIVWKRNNELNNYPYSSRHRHKIIKIIYPEDNLCDGKQ